MDTASRENLFGTRALTQLPPRYSTHALKYDVVSMMGLQCPLVGSEANDSFVDLNFKCRRFHSYS